MKIGYSTTFFFVAWALLISVLFVSFAQAFDLRQYVNYDILFRRFSESRNAFGSSNFSIQNQVVFQELNAQIYRATGINVLKIWVDSTRLLVGILRGLANLFEDVI